MANLKQWNEALVAHFLGTEGVVLFNVTEDVIQEIADKNEFTCIDGDAVKDFITAMCMAETGYEDDGWTPLPNEEWPENNVDGNLRSVIKNIFQRAYLLRYDYSLDLLRARLGRGPNFWEFPGQVPPWTSHLALFILAATMNVFGRPEFARYPQIADLIGFKLCQLEDEANQDCVNLTRAIIPQRLVGTYRDFKHPYWDTQPWLSNGRYQYFLRDFRNEADQVTSYEPLSRPCRYRNRVLKSFFNGETKEHSIWGMLYFWSEVQDDYPGRFKKIGQGGVLTDAVTEHARFRSQDRGAMIGALSKLNPDIDPSPEALNRVIHDGRAQFRQQNINEINNNKMSSFRQYAKQLWDYSFHEISSVREGTDIETQINVVRPSKFHVTPYFYVEPFEGSRNPPIALILARVHCVRKGTEYERFRILSIGGIDFIYNSEEGCWDSTEEINSGNSLVFSSTETLDVLSDNVSIGEALSSRLVLAPTRTEGLLFSYRNQTAMHSWNNSDEVSGGWLMRHSMQGHQHEQLSELMGQMVVLDRKARRYDDLHRITSTIDMECRLEGGTPTHGGQGSSYLIESPPYLKLVRGNEQFVTLFPEGTEWNEQLLQEPVLNTENGQKIWEFQIRRDLDIGDETTLLIKIPVEYTTPQGDDKEHEYRFRVDLNVDLWELHDCRIDLRELPSLPPAGEVGIFEFEEEEEAKKKAQAQAKAAAAAAKKAKEDEEAKKKAQAQAKAAAAAAKKAKKQEEIGEQGKDNPPPPDKPATRCTSCGVPLAEQTSTKFPCPNCGCSIGRCYRCRVNNALYRCVNCTFVGP